MAGASDDSGAGSGLFRALLRHWRQERNLSQLDLGLAADVSARHISFLETGRSQPSVEMVTLLAETLDIPLRARNEMLRAAGFATRYPEPSAVELLDGPLGEVFAAMLEGAEPYPMFIIDEAYDLVAFNGGAKVLVAPAGVELEVQTNLVRLLFDDRVRTFVDNWEDIAGYILRRLQRERIVNQNHEACAELLDELLAQPDIPTAWQRPRPDQGADPAFPLEVSIGDLRLRMMLTVTRFSAPSNITVEGLQIEHYVPLDDTTRAFFQAV